MSQFGQSVSHCVCVSYDSLSLWSSINRKSFKQWLTSNFQRHVSLWICRQKRGWRVRGVYLWHRRQGLRSCLLLFRSFLCSLKDVLQQQTTTFYFWTNSRIHFFHRSANKVQILRQGVPVCLLMGEEVGEITLDWHSTKQCTVTNSDNWLSMACSWEEMGQL